MPTKPEVSRTRVMLGWRLLGVTAVVIVKLFFQMMSDERRESLLCSVFIHALKHQPLKWFEVRHRLDGLAVGYVLDFW